MTITASSGEKAAYVGLRVAEMGAAELGGTLVYDGQQLASNKTIGEQGVLAGAHLYYKQPSEGGELDAMTMEAITNRMKPESAATTSETIGFQTSAFYE